MRTVAVFLLLLAACGRKAPPPARGGFEAWGTPRLAFGTRLGQLTPRGLVVRDPRSGRVVAEVDMDEPSGIGLLSDGSVIGVGVTDLPTLKQEVVRVRPEATVAERFPLVTVLAEGSSRILPDTSSPDRFFLVARLASRIQLERYELAPVLVGDLQVLPVRVIGEVEGGVFTGVLSQPDGTFLYRRGTEVLRLVPGQTARTIATLADGDREMALAPSPSMVWARTAEGDIALVDLSTLARGVRFPRDRSAGETIAIASARDRLALLQARGGELAVKAFRSDGAKLLEATVPWRVEEGEAAELRVSSDAAMVAVGTRTHVAIWELDGQRLTFAE